MKQIFIKTFLGTFLGTLLGTPFGTPSQFVGTLFGTRLGTHFKAHFWDTLRGTLWASPPLFHQRKGRDGEACSEEEPLILLPNCFKAAQSCCFSSSQRPNAQKFKGKLSSSIYFLFFFFVSCFDIHIRCTRDHKLALRVVLRGARGDALRAVLRGARGDDALRVVLRGARGDASSTRQSR